MTDENMIIKHIPKKEGIPGWFWAVLTFFVMVFVAFWVAGAGVIYILKEAQASLGHVSSEDIRFEEVAVDGEGDRKIVLIPVKGLIMDSGGDSWGRMDLVKEVSNKLKKAQADEKVVAVILQVDSPGGGVTASDILANRVKDFRKSGKVIAVSMEDIATSGAYYISAPSDYIIAHPTTITGSIGVLMQGFNLEVLLEKIGVQNVIFKSGSMKDIFSPTRDITEEEKKLIQDIVDFMFRRFISVVSQGRNLPTESIEAIADARIFTSDEALRLGLIDDIGYIEDAIDKVKELADVREAKIVRYKKESTLSELFLMKMDDINPVSKITNSNLLELNGYGGFRFLYLWKADL
ncbi:MAG: signal peptide peptidase SppA [Candidatus Aureabacteria bacterium]|nr:signal peptide peptidase SppA [Candidatus Auribacterota bacterium]